MTLQLKWLSIQLWAHRLPGPEKTPLALVHLIRQFIPLFDLAVLVPKKVAPLEICSVRRTPRAMTITAHTLLNLCTNLLTPRAETGLRVE